MNKLNCHFVAMAGLHGCIPNICQSFDHFKEAVDFMADIHELDRMFKAKLKNHHYLELNFHPTNPIIKDDGNEYIEIIECDCDNPTIHNDL